MNLAQVVMPDGRIHAGPWRPVLCEIPSLTTPTVTVREWSAAKQRHEERYVGAMRFAHICTLAADGTNRPLE